MRRVVRVLLILLGSCVLLWVAYAITRLPRYRTRLTRDGSGIVGELPPMQFARAELEALPAYQPGSPFSTEVDLRAYDLTKLRLASRLTDLNHATFNTRTRWPEELPPGFDPAAIIEMGKNPGLGLRALHGTGVTGEGVGLAIIDQGLLVDHVEYKDQLRLYEEIHCLDGVAPMHGPAVASIAVGKTVGVAPEADLYYIAETHTKHFLLQIIRTRSLAEGSFSDVVDFRVTAKSIRRLLEINRRLPEGKKIRVISITVGWLPYFGHTGYDDVTAAVAEAKKEGVFVVSTSLRQDYGLSFHGLGRDPMGDPDRLSSYTESSWDKYYLDQHPGAAPLFVPMGSRTTASPCGETEYVFYGVGGWSWCAPYIAGLYALACQVKPDITPEEFWAKAAETGDTIEVTSTVIEDPKGEIAKQFAARTDEMIADLKRKKQGAELERVFGQIYSDREGETRERMSEADFRAWHLRSNLRRRLGDGEKHQLGSIVNPARLIDSLRN
jgi:hypothetical protein